MAMSELFTLCVKDVDGMSVFRSEEVNDMKRKVNALGGMLYDKDSVKPVLKLIENDVKRRSKLVPHEKLDVVRVYERSLTVRCDGRAVVEVMPVRLKTEAMATVRRRSMEITVSTPDDPFLKGPNVRIE